MNIGDVFGLEKYSEAYEYIKHNNNAFIEDIGNKQYQLVELPKPNLESLKLAKRTEINQARDEAEQGGFTYLDKVFDSDQVACQRMSMAAQAMVFAPEGTTITWTTKDNSTIALDSKQLSGLVVALAEWSNTCHQKATELKDKIEACTTEDELNQIVWEK